MGEILDDLRELGERMVAANAALAARLDDPAEWPRRVIVHPDQLDEIRAALAAAGEADRYTVTASPIIDHGHAVMLPARTSPDAPENIGGPGAFVARRLLGEVDDLRPLPALMDLYWAEPTPGVLPVSGL